MRTISMIAWPRLRFEERLCTACRACELACHFHHTGTFGTAGSSVEVTLDGDTGAVTIAFAPSCDGCTSEPEPACARFCVPGALRAVT